MPARSRPAALAAALCLAACAGPLAPPEQPGEPALPAAPIEPSETPPTQTLFRVSYDGPAGDGRLRLVLRRAAADRFQIRTADALGRAVWSLELAASEVLLVDHRERSACRAGAELRVPEIALAPLPLVAIPRVLSGETPLVPPAGADTEDWTDPSGRRWTARHQAGELEAWTLWEEGRPVLWWSRQPRGGILSHRDGSQFRWKQAASEPLAEAAYPPLEVPEGYELGTCIS